MELQKGVCFLCRSVKVISTTHAAKEAYQIISSLFSKKILNVAEFNNVQSSLKLCPICYHKLLILKSIGNNIGTTNSEDDFSRDSCLLCKSGKILFNVTNWQHFNKTSEDLTAKENDQCIYCSDCLFYLDARYEVKTKLFSKYPQVKAKSQNEITNKKRRNEHNGSISDGITAHSTPIARSKRACRKDFSIEIINISDDEDEPKKKAVNFKCLKGLKPLKHNKILRGHKIIKTDSKFLNQIPYVLLNTSIARGDKNLSKVNGTIVPAQTVQIESNKATTPNSRAADNTEQKNKRLSSRSMIIKRTLNKHVIVKDLSVNLARINLSQKRRYLEDNLRAEKLNDASDLEDSVVLDKRDIKEKSTSDDFNTSGETSVKSKRKSVSFAEDKNVEIEYSPIRPKIISRRASGIGNVREKLSFDELIEEKSDDKLENDKGIEITEAAEKHANTKGTEKVSEEENSDKLSDKELDDSTGNNKEIDEQSVKNKSLNSGTSQKLNIASDEEAGEQTEDVVEKQTIDKKKKIPKADRPKPLSKKIKARTPKDNNLSENAERDSPTLSKRKELTDKDADEKIISTDGTESNENDSVKNDSTGKGNGELLANNENVGTSDEIKENDTNEDENCGTSKKSVADLDDEKDSRKLNVNSVRPKPGPLSKKKKALKADRAPLNDVDSTMEENNDSVNVPKESKASPLLEVGSSQSGDEQEKAEDNKHTDEAFKPIDRNLDDENKESDEEPAGDSKTDTESPTAVENDESNSFSDTEKAEELGITEHDKDNIDSILSNLVCEQAKSEDKTSNENDSEKFEDAENSDVNCGSKRKLSDDDELNTAIDKKKKKVTFCKDTT